MDDDVVPRNVKEKALIDAVRKAKNQDETISQVLKVCSRGQHQLPLTPHPEFPHSAP